ncbi:MAG: hypothetical protein ABIB04_04005 [Patescibacteria group bacterium]
MNYENFAPKSHSEQEILENEDLQTVLEILPTITNPEDGERLKRFATLASEYQEVMYVELGSMAREIQDLFLREKEARAEYNQLSDGRSYFIGGGDVWFKLANIKNYFKSRKSEKKFQESAKLEEELALLAEKLGPHRKSIERLPVLRAELERAGKGLFRNPN